MLGFFAKVFDRNNGNVLIYLNKSIKDVPLKKLEGLMEEKIKTNVKKKGVWYYPIIGLT